MSTAIVLFCKSYADDKAAAPANYALQTPLRNQKYRLPDCKAYRPLSVMNPWSTRNNITEINYVHWSA